MNMETQCIIAAIVFLVAYLAWRHKKAKDSNPFRPLTQRDIDQLGKIHPRR